MNSEIENENERILWQGKPAKQAYIFRGSLILIPFSVIWLVLVIIWIAITATHGASLISQIHALALLIFGLYLAIGRFWIAGKEADNTSYTITEKRLIIRTGTFLPYTVEIPLNDICSVRWIRSSSNMGSIRVVTTAGKRIALWCLPDAGNVYQIILERIPTAKNCTT
jgi:membrane protein YdbS with pleckstrin-like domain